MQNATAKFLYQVLLSIIVYLHGGKVAKTGNVSEVEENFVVDMLFNGLVISN